MGHRFDVRLTRQLYNSSRIGAVVDAGLARKSSPRFHRPPTFPIGGGTDGAPARST